MKVQYHFLMAMLCLRIAHVMVANSKAWGKWIDKSQKHIKDMMKEGGKSTPRRFTDADLLNMPQGATTDRQKRHAWHRAQEERRRAKDATRAFYVALFNAAVAREYPEAVDGEIIDTEGK